ncbi:MAG: ABC transporter substrate-binding protein [Spirochaetales bacterium]|nr:ABC transporter substrate-binding protein [Spirochaetales bacterium]
MKQLLAVSIVLLYFLSFSCVDDSERPGREVIVSLPETLSAVPVMELSGRTKGGVKIRTDLYGDHTMAMARLIRGESDILVTGFDYGLSHYSGGGDIVHILTFVWGTSSLVARDPGLMRLEDFSGKRIIVPFKGSPLDVQLDAMLEKSGLAGRVQTGYAVPQQAVPMLLSGLAEGICVPEPLASMVVVRFDCRRVCSLHDRWKAAMGKTSYTPMVSLFSKREFAAKNGRLLNGLIADIDDVIRHLPEKRGKKAFIESYAKRFSVDPDIFEEAFEHTFFLVPKNGASAEYISSYLEAAGYKDRAGFDFYYAYE